ncbi:MAG TPA: hypothetical protein VNM24_01930 [Burkholderiales bacterium]|nr:hypothetical protein [Burkholderiales bacterium]
MRLFKGLADFRTFREEWRKQGALGALKTAREAMRLRLQIAGDRRFDRTYGVDTCGLTLLTDLSVGGGNIADCVYYDPTPVRLLQRIFRKLPRELDEYIFVDFGSGKGRVLLAASRLPFRRIIGVEFARELHEIATRNIEIYRDPAQRCRDIQSVCIDAREFEIPPDKCVLFFYRPFSGPVFHRVLERIVASYRANPRKMYLVYCCPFSDDPFKSLDFARKIPLPAPLFERLLPGGIGAVLYETRE